MVLLVVDTHVIENLSIRSKSVCDSWVLNTFININVLNGARDFSYLTKFKHKTTGF